MNETYNKKLKAFSQKLRKEMTKEEKHLWYDFLKFLPCTFNRQKVIGEYIVDFYCAKANLAIEIDGWQHGTKENVEYDNKRTQYLEKMGIKVVRYSNKDIQKRFEAVCQDIVSYLSEI